MSHTTRLDNNWIAIGDSLLDDDSIVTIKRRKPPHIEIDIPYGCIKALVANQMRNDKVQEIETAKDDEILTQKANRDKERVQYGFLLMTLAGLQFLVDDDCKKVIVSALKKIGSV